MRILKIELQNINSLKSDQPFVIDFENVNFRDVGLYAITGSTGAGKTTILDAITIALYQDVPRFNRSNIKAGLIDVVSFGADEAFAAVQFENKSIRYEASWRIRLRSKNGKALTKPIEEVRLIDLDSGKILAEKKKELQIEVEKILQLSYKQFLRSAMLAQGEFASFLSATGPEKSRLLEQITGEDIYKKIGESINQKQYEERKLLETIKAKINHEDLLNQEDKLELEAQEKSLLEDNNKLDSELKRLRLIADWFEKENELKKQQDQLKQRHIKQAEFLKQQEEAFRTLELHEKAEPFIPILEPLNSLDQTLEEKNLKLNSIKIELNILAPKYEQAQIETQKAKQNLDKKQELFKNWLPRLDKVTSIDGKIENENRQLKTIEADLQEQAKNIEALKSKIVKLEQEKQGAIEQKQKLENYTRSKLFLSEIEPEISNWKVTASELKQLSNSSDQIKLDIQKHKETLKQLADNCTKSQKEQSENHAAFQTLEKEQQKILQELKENQIDHLLDQQKLLNENTHALVLLEEYSKSHQRLKQEQTQLSVDEKSIRLKLDTLKLELIVNHENMIHLKQSLLDAEHILKLEQSIKNLEAQRAELEEGKACPLCGSESHPLVKIYQVPDLLESEKEVNKRGQQIDELQQNINQQERLLAEYETSLKHKNEQLKNHAEQIELTQKQARSINLPSKMVFDLTDLKGIQLKQSDLEQKTQDLQTKIDQVQTLNRVKEKNEALLNRKKENINRIDTEILSIKEKQKFFENERTLKEESLELETNRLINKEEQLKTEVKVFNLEYPDRKTLDEWLKNLELDLKQFNLSVKHLQELETSLAKNKINIESFGEQLETQKQSFDQKDKLKIELFKTLKVFNDERQALLPLNISVAEQRLQLQNSLDQYKLLTEQADETLKNLELEKNQKTTLRQSHKAELEKLNEQQQVFIEKLNAAMVQSDFESRENLQAALLRPERKKELTELRKKTELAQAQIKEREVQLATDWAVLQKQKDFEETYSESQNLLKDLDIEKNKNQSRLGEIKQRFEMDLKIMNRNKSVYDEITAQELVLKKWKDLMDLLGGSKEAFNIYVQRLTLKNLIGLANIHLHKLNPRYSLKMSARYKKGEELNFKLVDHFQTDEMRYVDTSSGGEKFLISLALALGLSDLASQNVKIESLFIDEGFGTLDNRTLETVISTLETLQAEGKMIGIISHVENLKERIPTQIQLIKKSNGVSELQFQ